MNSAEGEGLEGPPWHSELSHTARPLETWTFQTEATCLLVNMLGSVQHVHTLKHGKTRQINDNIRGPLAMPGFTSVMQCIRTHEDLKRLKTLDVNSEELGKGLCGLECLLCKYEDLSPNASMYLTTTVKSGLGQAGRTPGHRLQRQEGD